MESLHSIKSVIPAYLLDLKQSDSLRSTKLKLSTEASEKPTLQSHQFPMQIYFQLANRQQVENILKKRKFHARIMSKPILPDVTQKSNVIVQKPSKLRLNTLKSESVGYLLPHQPLPSMVNKFQTHRQSLRKSIVHELKIDGALKKNDPIRRYDMVYDVKKLEALQKQRYSRFFSESSQNSDILRQQNQLNLIHQSNQRLGRLKNAAQSLVEQIKSQNQSFEELTQRCHDLINNQLG